MREENVVKWVHCVNFCSIYPTYPLVGPSKIGGSRWVDRWVEVEERRKSSRKKNTMMVTLKHL